MAKTDDEALAGLVACKLTKPSFPFLVDLKVNFGFLMFDLEEEETMCTTSALLHFQCNCRLLLPLAAITSLF